MFRKCSMWLVNDGDPLVVGMWLDPRDAQAIDRGYKPAWAYVIGMMESIRRAANG